MSKTFSTSDVASHNKPTDLYIIIDEDVYDLSTFADDHPGTFKECTAVCCLLSALIQWLMLIPRWKENSDPRCRQGRQQTILEISQRRHPQEIQGEAPGWIAG